MAAWPDLLGRAARALVVLVALLPALTRAEPSDGDWEPRLRGGLELLYNDNVLALSDARIDLFESGGAPERFRINSVGDYVVRSWLRGGLSFGGTEFGASLRSDQYVENSIKNNEQIGLYLRSRFDRNDALGLSYAWLRDGYAGELQEPGTDGVIDSAFFDVHDLDLRLVHRFSRLLSMTPRLAGRLFVYDGSLNNARSLAGGEVGLATRVEPLEWLDFVVDLGFEHLEALESRPDFDVSFQRYAVEAGPTVRLLGRDLYVSARYRYARRVFTTNNDETEDPSHRDRVDPSNQIQVRIEHFWERFSIYVAYERNDYHADIPGVPTLLDEDTTFTRNLFTIGTTLRY